MKLQSLFPLTLLAAAASAYAQAVQPQDRIEVQGQAVRAPALAPNDASVGELKAKPKDAPQSISVLTSDLLREAGTKSLSQAVKLDASLADFYNTTGYIESLQVRGFLLDNLYNYRRDGMPSSSYATLALENKTQLEILKGASGLQAGTSTPGGLMNTVLKRPERVRDANLSLGSGASLSADLGDKSERFGWRINAASESLRPALNDARGKREFLSAIGDLSLSAATTLEAEFETQRKRQPSVPGFGPIDSNGDGIADALPSARALQRVNLNAQPWSQPFENESFTGSVKLSHAFSEHTQATLTHARQRIHTNDRIAFPDGCSSGANYVYPGLCGNYDVDLYDYRSERELRKLASTKAQLNTRFSTGAFTHNLQLSALGWRYAESFNPRQAYNFAGTINALASSPVPASADPLDLNTLRAERSSELALVDTIRIANWTAFLGLRRTQTERESARTDGSRATRYSQSFTTPFLAASYALSKELSIYASRGQGVETEVVPNRANRFANAGEALPALKSTQTELGLKWQIKPQLLASAALFEIEKPYSDDDQSNALPTRIAGGKLARHRGAEFALAGSVNRALSVSASAAWLDARIARALTPGLAGTRVLNISKLSLSAFADYKFGEAWGINAKLRYQSEKNVFVDGSLKLPAATQIDLGLRYKQQLASSRITWRLAIENIANKAYWQDAPTQSWGGVYLFASPPRRASLSAQWEL